MSEALAAFHFLRPWWLLALLPAAVLAVASLRSRSSAEAWARVMDPALLSALLMPQTARRGALPLSLLIAGWSLAVIGLAGPAWERLPEPVHRRGDALVVVLDLSTSMRAGDLSPSRLARARFKLEDLLSTRRDAYTGLVAYAGDAHVVTPLSDDTGTVAAMLPALDPDIMPVPGSDPVAALRVALELLRGANMPGGRVLLVADALDDSQARAMNDLLRGTDVSLAVLGVGTPEGAPVPLDDGGFARDEGGGIAIPRLDLAGMREAAASAGATFRQISVDDADLRALLPDTPLHSGPVQANGTRIYDQWRDLAPWIALVLLPLAATALRQGWLLLLPLCAGLALPAPRAEAFEWQDLWLRKDQQAAAALATGDAELAARLFRDPAWKGSAQYQAGDYAGSAASFAGTEGPDANYNRGNALARGGKLEEALKAYDAALAVKPDMEDARTNRKIVEDLLRQQEAQKNPTSADGQQTRDQKPEQPGQDPQQAGEDGSRSDASNTRQQNSDGATPPENGDKESADQPQSGGASEKPPESEKDSGTQPEAAQEEKNGTPSTAEEAGAGAETSGQENRKPGDAEIATDTERKSQEEDQAVEQWLRQVPDDPGALLRRKFEYEAARRPRGGEQ